MVCQPLHSVYQAPTVLAVESSLSQVVCSGMQYTSDVRHAGSNHQRTVPVTWGEAMDVPFSSKHPLASHSSQFPVGTVEFIATPGAASSRALPVLEKLALDRRPQLP